jgi:2-iminobutanoate/2-iminopropanoate deaminase
VTVRVLVALALASCASPAPPLRAEYIRHDGPAALPFSQAVRVGDVVYLSGQIGTRPGDFSAVVPGGIEEETRQTMENIRAALEKSGSSMDRVVKCTVMLADMKDWPAMNAVYARYFSNAKPARSSFGATGLALGAKVEIECLALAR